MTTDPMASVLAEQLAQASDDDMYMTFSAYTHDFDKPLHSPQFVPAVYQGAHERAKG